MPRQLSSIVGILLTGIVFLFATAPSASALSLGLQWTGDWAQPPAEMDVVGKSGAALFRLPVSPDQSADGNDWSYYDAVFGQAAEHGVTILPHFGGRIDGKVGLPEKGEQASWSAWAQKAVRRYGYNGVFWSTHPGIPAKPVTAWEMWNEPNNSSFGTITAAEYGTFLAWAGPAVQSASQSWSGQTTGVLFGGLLAWSGGTNYQTYLNNAYKVPGASSAFTGFAFHPYELDTSQFPSQTRFQAFEKAVNGARSFLNSLPGGTGKSLWITETGWPVEFDYAVSEAEQASLLTESFDWAKNNAESLSLRALLWYNYRDRPEGVWQYRCGLRNQSGQYRLSWWAFQGETGAPAWPPPTVETKPASGVQEEQATLNGTVNPNRKSTTYRFEYGLTTSYGSSLPIPDGEAGNGGAAASVSAMPTDLRSATTYHYRLVATNAAGTSYGSDVQFTTPIGARPSVVIDPSNGLAGLWRGTDGNLYETVAPGGKWTTFSPTWGALGGITVMGNPSVVIDPSNGLAAVWRGSDGNLYETVAPGGKWTTFSPTWGVNLGGVTVTGNPNAVIDPNNGLASLWRGSDGNLYETVAPGGKWTTFSPTWGALGSVTLAG